MALVAVGAVELAPLPSPGFFYSRLFVMWLSSGSWRPVMTLSHLLCFCDSVSISDGDHSVCAPVRISGDWMAYIVLRAAFSSGAGPSCFSSPSALPLLRHCLSIQGSLLCPFHSSASLLLGLGSCFRLYPLSASPHEALTRRLTHPVFLSCLPRQGSSDCSLCLSRVGDCHTSPNVHPCAFTGGMVSRCAAGLDLSLGFSVAGSLLLASVTSRSISVLRLASRELMALAAGSSSSLAQLVPDDRLRLRSLQL